MRVNTHSKTSSRPYLTTPFGSSMVFTPPSVPPLSGDRNVIGREQSSQGEEQEPEPVSTESLPLKGFCPPMTFLSPDNGGTEGGVKTIEG